MKNLTITGFALFLVTLMLSCSPDKKINIACIGDSITEGYGLAKQSETAYPVVLQNILGPNYKVLNSGRSATTLQKQGDFPFWICKEFSNVFAFNPNIITIKLGTNDTKPQNWNPERYKADYQALIDTLQTIAPKPAIFLCLPVPVYQTNWGITDSIVINGIIPIINELALKNNLKTIDLYSGLQNNAAFFPDGIHPNEDGMKIIAKIISESI
jgi:acyl-CoA thioesterase I